MGKRVRKSDQRQRTTVFIRIVSRLCVPLLLLGLIFVIMQLTTQLNVLNEFHGIRGQIVFEKIHTDLKETLQTIPQGAKDLSPLNQQLEELKNSLALNRLAAFDLLNRKVLFASESSDWTSEDDRAIEESLYQKQLGKSFHVKVDRMNQELIAYIPLQGNHTSQIVIVKAVISLADIHQAIAASKWRLILILGVILIIGILISRSLTNAIVKPLTQLKETTQEIVKGELGKHVHIHTGDEIETLAHTFNQMSDTIKLMKKQAEDSNPLTQLPGNQGIYHELNQRIYERRKFVLLHADIDRFKLFNDHFGLARGDQVIKHTAEILKKAVKEKGAQDDFVGHQGGDDFILVVLPSHAHTIGNYVCKLFDTEVRSAVYRKEDLDKGHTVQLDRRRMAETGEEVTREFPLISISLAGISNVKNDFSDYFSCMAAAVEVKKEAKQTTESVCLIKE